GWGPADAGWAPSGGAVARCRSKTPSPSPEPGAGRFLGTPPLPPPSGRAPVSDGSKLPSPAFHRSRTMRSPSSARDTHVANSDPREEPPVGRSRCSGVPSSSPTRQVPQNPCLQEQGVSGRTRCSTSSTLSSSDTGNTGLERPSCTSKGRPSMIGAAAIRSQLTGASSATKASTREASGAGPDTDTVVPPRRPADGSSALGAPYSLSAGTNTSASSGSSTGNGMEFLERPVYSTR